MCYSLVYACETLAVKCDPSHCRYNTCKDEFSCLDGYEYYEHAIKRFKFVMVLVLGVLIVGFILTNSGIKWYSRKKNKVRPIKSGQKFKKTTASNNYERFLVTCGSDLNSNN